MSKPEVRALGKNSAQVIVEMILILPIFLAIVFSIMEMGYISFQMILLNHATYEVARIGAMTRSPASGGAPKAQCGDLQPLMQRILETAKVVCRAEENDPYDMQADVRHMDLVVTGFNSIRLIFPISSLWLSNPKGSGHRMITATVRMPIERPLRQ